MKVTERRCGGHVADDLWKGDRLFGSLPRAFLCSAR
jgi:hypothetical protein